MESSSLVGVGSLNTETSNFNPIDAVLDAPVTLVGTLSKEDLTVDEAGRVDELRGGVWSFHGYSF